MRAARLGLTVGPLILLMTAAASVRPTALTQDQPTRLPTQDATARLLTRDAPSQRRLAAGEVHAYRVQLRTGEYLEATIDQRGIDVAARMLDPSGAVLREFDSPTGALGLERVRMVAAGDGVHRLEVRALQPEADAGDYEIRITTVRPAQLSDRQTEAAVFAESEADRLRAAPLTRGESLGRYREARALWRTAADPAGEASALRGMGFALLRLKQDPEAVAVFSDAQTLFRKVGDRRAEAYVYLILAAISARQGDLTAAIGASRQALPLWRAARDPEQEAFTLATIATTHARLKEAPEARQMHDEALRVARATGRPTLEAAMFRSVGSAAEELGDRTGALEAYLQALGLWRQAKHRRGEASTHFAIAGLQETLGDVASAIDHYGRAADLWRDAGVSDQEAVARGRISALKK